MTEATLTEDYSIDIPDMAHNFILNQEYSEQDYIVCLAWGKELLTINSSPLDCFKAEVRNNMSGYSGYSNYQRGLLRYPVINDGIVPARKTFFADDSNLGIYFNQIFIVKGGKQRGHKIPRILRRYAHPDVGEESLLVPKYGLTIENIFSYSPPNSNMFVVDKFDRARETWFSGQYYESTLNPILPHQQMCNLGDDVMLVVDRRMDQKWQNPSQSEGFNFGEIPDTGSTPPSGLTDGRVYKICWVNFGFESIYYRITDQDISNKNIITNGNEIYYEGVTPIDILDSGTGYSYMTNVTGETVTSIITFPKLICVSGSQVTQANFKSVVNGIVSQGSIKGIELNFAS